MPAVECREYEAPPAQLADLPPPDAERGSVVDLFCGIGGLSHGFVLEGFDVRAGVDVDRTCRFAYETNNLATFYEKDIEYLDSDWVNSLFAPDTLRVLVGCAPCQPFSPYTRRSGEDRAPEWCLLEHFGRIVREAQPEIVSMENVPRLAIADEGRLFHGFLADLDGYEVWAKVVDCADYGVPQMRSRLVVLASRIGPIELEEPTHGANRTRTVRQAIGQLPPIEAGQACEEDALHRASRLSDQNLKRIKAATPGGRWRDWPDQSLVAECHRKRSGRFYNNVYGRMSWDDLAPTITTQCYGFGNGRFGHPAQDRAISLREAALLQTFPPYYALQPPDNQLIIAQTARWIGNAVPVELSRAVARSVAAVTTGAEVSKAVGPVREAE